MRLNNIHVSSKEPVNPSLWVDTSGKNPILKGYVNGQYVILSEDVPDNIITKDMIVDSLESDATDVPLSAAQGKALNEKILNSGKVYVINRVLLNEGSPTSEQISEAIGGWDNLVNAIQNNYIIILYFSPVESSNRQVVPFVSCTLVGNVINIEIFSNSACLQLYITNTSGTLSIFKKFQNFLDKENNYSELQTTYKTIIGSINEINTLANSKADSQDITNAINTLDSSGQTASTGEVISSVSQENGVLSVSKKALTSDDIPKLPQSKITDLSANLAAKQDILTAGTGIEITPENRINVTLDTTVFKVVSALPDSPAAGDENKIHLVPAESTEEGNIYTEYVYVNGKWEKFGTYRSEVDLTPYMKKADAEATYQKITDNTLATTAKTVVGAINENTGNVTRIDRAVGNPTVTEHDFVLADNGYFWNTNGSKQASSSWNISESIQLNKGDMIQWLGASGSTNISILTKVSSDGEFLESVIFGEPNKTKYAYIADAPCFVQVAVSQGTLANPYYIIKSPFNTAISDNSYMQYLHKVYEEYGAVYNAETGYWEYGDLKDMTEEDCFLAAFYALEHIQGDDLRSFILDRYNITQARTYFTKIRPKGDYNTTTLILNSCFAQSSNLEYLKLSTSSTSVNLYINNIGSAFRYCPKLRKIEDILSIYNTNSMTSTFVGCSALRDIKIRLMSGANTGVSFQDSPLISYESLNYLVTNAANTAAITVTVHPTTYSYLTGTAQPTEEVGGTTEEWQALVTTAQGKQISFAQPAETLEVEPLE